MEGSVSGRLDNRARTCPGHPGGNGAPSLSRCALQSLGGENAKEAHVLLAANLLSPDYQPGRPALTDESPAGISILLLTEGPMGMNAEAPGGGVDWLDRFFTSYYAHRPVNATFIGVHGLDHLLPDFSENGAGDTLAEMQSLLRSAERAPAAQIGARGTEEPKERFDTEERTAVNWPFLDRRLAEGFLKIQLWEFESQHFHRGNPSLYASEAVFGTMSLFLSDFAPMAERIEAATARLEGVPTLLRQGRENLRRAPSAWTERAVGECTGALAFLDRGIELLIAEASPRTGEPLAVAGMRDAAGTAREAFAEYLHFLESELFLHPSTHYACGEAALSLYLREGHFLDQGPQDLLAYAESELAEASARVNDHPRFTPEHLRGLADLHPTIDGYCAAYQEEWDAVRDRSQEHDLLTWPDFPIRYVPRPLWAREAAPYLYFLFYRSPAAYQRPPVHEYLVTPIDAEMPEAEQEELLRANNNSVIKLNHVIHHGGIGHHVQNWHAFRSPSRVGQIAAVDCASRIAMFCGGTMAEGWACYATDLMVEVGGLTPLEAFAEKKGRTRMCARTIVDLRMHLGRMTLGEAVDFYMEHAGMARPGAEAEAVKNSMFPGAAVIYLLGTDAIHSLRKELSARRGPAFTLRGFHDEFLSYGSIPVSLIAREMTAATGK